MNKVELLPFNLEKALSGRYDIFYNFPQYDEEPKRVCYFDWASPIQWLFFIVYDNNGTKEAIRTNNYSLLSLKPKKEPQFGDKILVKDKRDIHWEKDRRFLWMSKSGFPITIENDDFDYLNTNINDTAKHVILATYEKWKWPEQENKEPELDEISKLDYHQRDSEWDRMKILEGKVEEMIDVVNKFIKERNETK